MRGRHKNGRPCAVALSVHTPRDDTDVPMRRRSSNAAENGHVVRRIERFHFICAVRPFHRNLDTAFPAKQRTRLTAYRGIHENVQQSGRRLDSKATVVNSRSEPKPSLKSRKRKDRTRRVRVFVSFEKQRTMIGEGTFRNWGAHPDNCFTTFVGLVV